MYRNVNVFNILPHIFIYILEIIVELFSIFYQLCIKDNDHFNDKLTACVGFVSEETYMFCAFVIRVNF